VSQPEHVVRVACLSGVGRERIRKPSRLAKIFVVTVPPNHIGMLLHHRLPKEFGSLTVMENLRLATTGDARQRAASLDLVYDIFPSIRDFSARYGNQISGGQQQMVAIARALLNKNEILLVDEPTKGLAPKLVTEVAEALTKVAEQSTMLLVEQNLALVKRVAHHVIVMDQGRVVYQGGPENLNDDSWVHQMLGVSGGHN